ncbi:hypothetical protein K488DRAFT_82381 [Vararia minispora EC-137]|uniref:Uncharacterized protein n=1 Tax=Vararia minispora EC-137 TaxID=1314806 RepID=A0ACB8QWD5_9AGAM|nr:hypothetical protein K488DRAFT_82381 [Vararia minispora EC-137]
MPKPRSGRLRLAASARDAFVFPLSFSLLNLPVELIADCFAFLQPRDVLSCRLTCSTLHRIVRTNARLQLALQLAFHQLVPSHPPSVLPAAILHALVQDRESRWRDLRWRDVQNHPMPNAGAIYEFVGGIYCNARGGQDERRVNGAITFYQLPDSDQPNRTGVRAWTLLVPDLVILDFSVDPAQDLAVFVALSDKQSAGRYQIHFRTLSTNSPHPLARQAVLDCAFQPGQHTLESSTTFRILIHGQILLLLVKDVLHSHVTFLSLTNWHTGPDACYTFPPHTPIEDVVFLSPHEFLVVVPSGAFDVYAFPDPSPTSPPTLLRRFELPRLKSGHRYWYATATANPAPGARVYDASASAPTSYYDNTPASANLTRDPPPTKAGRAPRGVKPPAFASRPDDGLVAVALGTLSPAPENHMSCYVVFVRTSLLLARARSPAAAGVATRGRARESAADGVPAGRRARWREWGPGCARWFRDRLSSDWQHAVHGFRTAERVLPDDPALRPLLRGRPPPPVHPVRHCIRVRDFNPCLLRADSPSSSASSYGMTEDGEWVFADGRAPSRVVRAPSRIRARESETFAEDVVSSLPYREAVSEEALAVSDIMMDDARILCLRRGTEGRLVSFDVLTF